MLRLRRLRLLLAVSSTAVAFVGLFGLVATLAYGESHAIVTVCWEGPPTCDYNTIQAAIDSQPYWAEVRIAQGTYHGFVERPRYDTEATGIVTQVVYIKDKYIKLLGGYSTSDFEHAYPITQPTVLDAENIGRVIYAVGNTDLVVQGLHIINGTSQYSFNPGNYSGGGIFAMTGTVQLIGNWFEKNGAYTFGGAMYLLNTTSTIKDNAIAQNSAGGKGGQGGGIAIAGGNATISANQVYSNGAHWIGGIALYGVTATLQSNVITNNGSSAVGGIQVNGGSVKLTNNRIEGNYANVNYGPGGTGGLRIQGGKATLIGNTIRNNTINGDVFLGSGAGIQIYGADVLMDYNAITGNRVVGGDVFVRGGGVQASVSAITLTHNLIADNVASVGGGVYIDTITNGTPSLISPPSAFLSTNQIVGNRAHYGAAVYISGPDQVRVVNTVFADNLIDGSPITATFFSPRLDGSPTGSVFYLYESHPEIWHATIDHNTGGDGTGIAGNGSIALTNTIFVRHEVGINLPMSYTARMNSTLWGNTVNISGSTTLISANNVFGDPNFADAANHDYHLRSGSAAIDRGVDTNVYVDIDGQPRPIGDKPDLGVDEYLAPTVTNTPLPTATMTASPSPTPHATSTATPSPTPSPTEQGGGEVTVTTTSSTSTRTTVPTPSKTFTPLPPEPPMGPNSVFLPVLRR